jgi:hypothetical protein
MIDLYQCFNLSMAIFFYLFVECVIFLFFSANFSRFLDYRKPSDVAPWRNSKMENFGGLLLSYFKDSKSEFFSGCTIVGFLH